MSRSELLSSNGQQRPHLVKYNGVTSIACHSDRSKINIEASHALYAADRLRVQILTITSSRHMPRLGGLRAPTAAIL
jgi:hypothetical protein